MFRNEARGLRVVNTGFEHLSEGVYSIVFVDCAKRRILKVFSKAQGFDFEHSKKVFDSEVEAYKIAMKASELKDLVPKFFGTRRGLLVEDKCGTDVTNEFHPDLASELEFISDDFIKINEAPGSDWEQITRAFKDRGIEYMSDASVTIKNEKIQKVIDFAIKEFERPVPDIIGPA